MELRALSLRESHKFDRERNHKPTRWFLICKEREGKPFTRKARVKRNKSATPWTEK